ncbi:MAG: DUF255 domain-containing protein [Chitinophagales bacterium]
MLLKKILLIHSVLLFFAFSVIAGNPSKPNPNKEKVQWMSFEEAVEKSANGEKRKIFIDVYTDWCGWCKKMDATTFSHPEIAAYLNENYYPVKLDGERKDTVVVNEKTYVFVAEGRRGYHELAAALMNGRMSYPTIVLLDEQFNMIQPIPGYRQAPELDEILKYYGKDLHKQNVSFEDFKANYDSPFE